MLLLSEIANAGDPVVLDEKPRFFLSSKSIDAKNFIDIYIYVPIKSNKYCFWDLCYNGNSIKKGELVQNKSNIIHIKRQLLDGHSGAFHLMAYDSSMRPNMFQLEDVRIQDIYMNQFWISLLMPVISAVIAYYLYYANELRRRKIEDTIERQALVYQIEIYINKLTRNVKGFNREKINAPLFFEKPYESKWSKILVEDEFITLLDNLNSIATLWEISGITIDDALGSIKTCEKRMGLMKINKGF